jgi:DNA polymerase III subunit epsilon
MITKESDLIASKQLLENLSFCIIDLETTGGNQQTDKIIEIGLVRIENMQITEEKEFLINPEIAIPEFIQKLTGISPRDVENAQKIEQVISEIVEFIGESIVVAHNISFDIPFLNSVLRRLGMQEIENKVICTNVMTKYLIPEIMNSNLNYLSSLFDIRHQKAHRAIEDSRATAELLIKYLQIYIEKGIRKVNQLYYPKNHFELDRMNFNRGACQFEDLLQEIQSVDSPVTITYKGDKGVILAVHPFEHASSDIDLLSTLFNEIAWEVITVRLHGPLIESFVEMNAHWPKISLDEKIAGTIIQHLKNRYGCLDTKDAKTLLNQIDFIVTPHLIMEQLICYSFVNFNPGTRLVFKYPGHKKKFINYAQNQFKRMAKNGRGQKRRMLHPTLEEIMASFLKTQLENENSIYLSINQKHLFENLKELSKMIEHLLMTHPNPYAFPQKHL